jgi:hypothetical protein
VGASGMMLRWPRSLADFGRRLPDLEALRLTRFLNDLRSRCFLPPVLAGGDSKLRRL